MTPKEKLTFALQHISSSYVDSSYTKTDKSKQLKKACIKAIWMIVEKNYSRTYVCKSLPKKYDLVSGNILKKTLDDVLPEYVKKRSYGVQNAKFFRNLEANS